MKRLLTFLLGLLPLGLLALFAADIFFAMIVPKKDGEFHVRDFGRLPVLLSGRIQPFDSVGRNALLQIRSTGDVPLEEVPSWKFWHHAQKLRSSEWLLEVMTRPQDANTRPIFLITHSDLLGELKLQDIGVDRSGLRYYTFNQLKPVLDEIMEQGRKANEVKSEQQTPFQKQVNKLANAVILYERLQLSLQPENAKNFAGDLASFESNLGPLRQAALSDDPDKFDNSILQQMAAPFRQFKLMADYAYPVIVPPLQPRAAGDQWQNAGASLLESIRSGQLHPAMTYLAAVATAYSLREADDFNRAVAAYQQWLKPNFEYELAKGRAEFYFNDAKPFLHAMIIYICAFLLACGAVLSYTMLPAVSESLRRSAFYLILLAGLVHTFGLVFRMVL